MGFETIELKPMSKQILLYLADKEPMKAVEVAEALNLGTRQVDAAVTKTLVRYGFVIREATLSRVLKKETKFLKVTNYGKQYAKYLATC